MADYLLVYEGGDPNWKTAPPEDVQAVMAQWGAWFKELESKGVLRNPGSALAPGGATLRKKILVRTEMSRPDSCRKMASISASTRSLIRRTSPVHSLRDPENPLSDSTTCVGYASFCVVQHEDLDRRQLLLSSRSRGGLQCRRE